MVEIHQALTPELQYLFDEAFLQHCGEHSVPSTNDSHDIHYVPFFRPWDEIEFMRSTQNNRSTGHPLDSEASIAEAMKQYINEVRSRGES